jgi:hypothetical protein
MSAEREIQKLQRHIEDLEYRLEEYHAYFSYAANQRDILALDAAWGVANGVVGLIAFALVFMISKEWIGLDGWVLGIVAGVAGTIAQGVAFAYSDKGRFKDRNNMTEFPDWECKADKLQD